MAKKYKKITEKQVLDEFCKTINIYGEVGIWREYISISDIAVRLGSSKYQVKNHFKNLVKKGYLEFKKCPTAFEDYDNGLYSEAVPILWCKAYVLSDKGYEYADKLYWEE